MDTNGECQRRFGTPEKRMQHFTVKDCIHAHAPYLSHLLKMDNLPPFCKHVSEHVLREAKSTVVSV